MMSWTLTFTSFSSLNPSGIVDFFSYERKKKVQKIPKQCWKTISIKKYYSRFLSLLQKSPPSLHLHLASPFARTEQSSKWSGHSSVARQQGSQIWNMLWLTANVALPANFPWPLDTRKRTQCYQGSSFPISSNRKDSADLFLLCILKESSPPLIFLSSHKPRWSSSSNPCITWKIGKKEKINKNKLSEINIQMIRTNLE